MTVEVSLKREILDGLRESLKRASAMEVELTFMGKQSEANDCATAIKKFSQEIDAVMGELIDEWAEQASTINEDITALNDKLGEAKEQLMEDVDNTTHIVDAISFIDDLTFIAKRLLKP